VGWSGAPSPPPWGSFRPSAPPRTPSSGSSASGGSGRQGWFRGPDRPVLLLLLPGLLFSALAAAESAGLEVTLVVSLGSSTWGANRPQFPWPAMGRFLRRRGSCAPARRVHPGGGLRNRRGALGGGAGPAGAGRPGETGCPCGPPPGRRSSGFGHDGPQDGPDRIGAPQAGGERGGSHANLGDREAVLALQPGLLAPSQGEQAGDGVIGPLPAPGSSGAAPPGDEDPLRPHGDRLRRSFRRSLGESPWAAAVGLGLFAGVLASCRRFRFTETQKKNPNS
jgi:hypothetical protein